MRSSAYRKIKRKMRKSIVLKSILMMSVLFILGSAVSAQDTLNTPEAAAKAYFSAMQAGDWTKLASLTHPDALADLKKMFATALKTDTTGDAGKTIFKLKSADEFAALKDEEVLVRLMDFFSSVAPEVKTALTSSTNTILGKVDEGDSTSHVVFRSKSKLENDEVNEVDLISFKKQGGNWRALLTSDLEDMFNRLVDEITPQKEDDKAPAGGAKKPDQKP